MRQLVLSILLPLWRYLHRRRITILMLHGVANITPGSSWEPLWERPTTRKLNDILEQLGRHYTFLSLADAVDILAGRKPPVDHGLVFTFDDGYRNNVSEAWPVLQAHGATGTLFVATGFVEQRRAFWIDRLDYAIQAAPDDARKLRHGAFQFDLRGFTRAQLIEGYRTLRLKVKKAAASDEEMHRIFAEFSRSLEGASGKSIDDVIEDDLFASVARWDELATAAKGGLTIGSHTVDHCRLSKIPREGVDAQLLQSRREIGDRLGGECPFFAYPNGSYDPFVLERVVSAGYSAAVTTLRGLNRIGDNLYTLRRYPFPMKASVLDNLFAISGIRNAPILSRVFPENASISANARDYFAVNRSIRTAMRGVSRCFHSVRDMHVTPQ